MEQLDGNHIVIKCILKIKKKIIEAIALVDYSVTIMYFIDGQLRYQHAIPHSHLDAKYTINIIDRCPVSLSKIKLFALAKLRINSLIEVI
jgi:hypothetical protein